MDIARLDINGVDSHDRWICLLQIEECKALIGVMQVRLQQLIISGFGKVGEW